MDVATDQLDKLIERRRQGREGRDFANEHHELWLESVRRYNARRREQHRWEWIRHFDRMARNHARISQEYERRAEELCQEGAA